jgi:hypothetical protein
MTPPLSVFPISITTSMPSSPPSEPSQVPTPTPAPSSIDTIKENVVDNAEGQIIQIENDVAGDITDASASTEKHQHLSMPPTPVTDLVVSPPPLVAVLFDGVHAVVGQPSFFGTNGGGSTGTLTTLDENIQLDENDGDVLERGIVVNSPAFTYVYEDVTDGPPPLSLSVEEAAAAGAGAISWDGNANAAEEAQNNASSSFRLQYLGPLDDLDNTNTVVLNTRAIDSENKAPPPPPSSTPGRNSTSSRSLSLSQVMTDESTSTLGRPTNAHSNANSNNNDGSSSRALAELLKAGQSLQGTVI